MATFVIGGFWHGAGWTFLFWGFLHGMALVIHRLWSNLGFKMWTWLAWLITFNFVNVAWIFFRAREWEDAIKVLSSMFSLNNVVLPNFLESKLQFLKSFEIIFGGFVENIGGDYFTPLWFVLAFVLVLAFKNSMYYLNIKLNKKYLILSIFLFSYAFITSLVSSSNVFLYFNF
ncbi:acetylase domain-containing protein [Sulfurospirillum multivorans DSM 12446]|uniref:Acetylase domain-containing protein n=3 Tax=Sulfurospirillum multivorans TaxID=66821 RepID=A0AA86AKB6_SULMK|nr:acetylase domain-containing protein [Sulfurospirillum multivorans DSM 12446]